MENRTPNFNVTLDAAESINLITALEYLKEDLQKIDVSADWAADEDETVTAWDLLNEQLAIVAMRAEAEKHRMD